MRRKLRAENSQPLNGLEAPLRIFLAAFNLPLEALIALLDVCLTNRWIRDPPFKLSHATVLNNEICSPRPWQSEPSRNWPFLAFLAILSPRLSSRASKWIKNKWERDWISPLLDILDFPDWHVERAEGEQVDKLPHDHALPGELHRFWREFEDFCNFLDRSAQPEDKRRQLDVSPERRPRLAAFSGRIGGAEANKWLI